MMRPLTREQARAATTTSGRTYIEATPGSGKTTVAAERYGVHRFDSSRTPRTVVGLSFARSARNELLIRVARRWGPAAAGWPHGVLTIDALHRDLVAHLLKSGEIEWPGGHTDLTVLDSWRGQRGARSLTPEYRFVRVATVRDGIVTTTSRRIGRYVHGFGSRAAHEDMLRSGICTHDEIRQVLGSCLTDEGHRSSLSAYIERTVGSLIIDEIFDGNRLDLLIVRLAVEAGIPITLIGDPWQALYEFRGARPELVPDFLEMLGFDKYPLSTSFRFQTAEMQNTAEELRAGRSTTLDRVDLSQCDVVLATRWSRLWELPAAVLPLSFGQIANQTDAAIDLLLQHFVQSRFPGQLNVGPEASVVLGLESVEDDSLSELLQSTIEDLGQSSANPEDVLDGLRSRLRALGPARMPRLSGDNETRRVRRLAALAARLHATDLTPAMTVHQAKGREWDVVGLSFSDGELAKLRSGLREHDATDRALYVAVTRARCQIGRL